ncbi:MAG: ATP-binding cassette domain-containing protein [Myxococcota bacterium]
MEPPPTGRRHPELRDFARLEGVSKWYDDGNQVFRGLDFSAPRGQLSVVIGGSGSGKSTLLRVLLGLEPYQQGSVQLMGREVATLSPSEHTELMMDIGMLFQFGALFDSMTVYENVSFALRHVKRRPEEEIRQVVRENLLLVGLKNVDHLYPSQLSGGMRKRVALARALAHQPSLLLVDEPTTGLDPIMAETINELILQMRERLGVTVLCITHDIHAAFKIADRISMLYQGKIIASGTPDELRMSEHSVVQQFLAGSAHGPITP